MIPVIAQRHNDVVVTLYTTCIYTVDVLIFGVALNSGYFSLLHPLISDGQAQVMHATSIDALSVDSQKHISHTPYYARL